MTTARKSAEQRVTAAFAAEEPLLPSLEEALDDDFGERFEVPCSVPGVRIAGNWNNEAETDMDTRMGLIEAVLEDARGATRAHARGFLLTRPRGFGHLDASSAVDAADTVNDTYMAAAMAMAAEDMLGGKCAVLVVTGFSGRTRADRRTVVEAVVRAVTAWEERLDAIGIAISIERPPLDRIALRSGVDRETALQLIEDVRRTEVAGIASDAQPRAALLPLGAMSFDESLLALGRFHCGEAPATILAARTDGQPQDMIYGAAKMPVPVALLTELRGSLEGRHGRTEDWLGAAMKAANAHVIATGAAPAGSAIVEGRALNSTATLISASLYLRFMALEAALEDQEVGAMLYQLRDQDRTHEVLDVAASAALDPGIGHKPFFLPEFRDRIEEFRS